MARPRSKNPRVHRVAVMLTDDENDILNTLSYNVDADRAETLRKCMRFAYHDWQCKRDKNASYNREQ